MELLAVTCSRWARGWGARGESWKARWNRVYGWPWAVLQTVGRCGSDQAAVGLSQSLGGLLLSCSVLLDVS